MGEDSPLCVCVCVSVHVREEEEEGRQIEDVRPLPFDT